MKSKKKETDWLLESARNNPSMSRFFPPPSRMRSKKTAEWPISNVPFVDYGNEESWSESIALTARMKSAYPDKY